jgi:hypothetical protein
VFCSREVKCTWYRFRLESLRAVSVPVCFLIHSLELTHIDGDYFHVQVLSNDNLVWRSFASSSTTRVAPYVPVLGENDSEGLVVRGGDGMKGVKGGFSHEDGAVVDGDDECIDVLSANVLDAGRRRVCDDIWPTFI